MHSDNRTLITRVDLGDRSYDVIVGEQILCQIGDLLRRHDLSGSVAVISNPVVLELYRETIEQSLDSQGFRSVFFTIGEGEEYKTLDTVQHLYDELLQSHIERTDTIVALGGGQTGDIAGFVAATLLRGINLVQIPTTVLAQVDAAIGGKTGVNLPLGKNLVGAFYQPRFVLADVTTLRSLPDREFNSGIAEVIKYGCIRDREFFEYLELNMDVLVARDGSALLHAISVSCGIKAEIVRHDEREMSGLRATLNFGHTIGHALETLTGYRHFLHGEAVATGMIAAGYMGTVVTGFPVEEFTRLEALIRRAGFTVDIGDLTNGDILDRTRMDKKAKDGQVGYVLPRHPGEVVTQTVVPDEVVSEALDYIRAST